MDSEGIKPGRENVILNHISDLILDGCIRVNLPENWYSVCQPGRLEVLTICLHGQCSLKVATMTTIPHIDTPV